MRAAGNQADPHPNGRIVWQPALGAILAVVYQFESARRFPGP